ncbi:putative protein phosphatase 2C [Gregarina niphandrodes]|uniref:PPM-type phosphatase domain-containing protein n=1 Tax=Gregarina niphandrodes TaxID=110365 RepID=A0A023B4X1_GRENI|nr:putative protein phosphatase 2C [Gregarina niphandrodes]EZG57831.1 putative protein phosphatase 2C [Gregarina niphandrodes]|eukprot:XP_011131028.1 putative protein phosphatase 2C [Gregarina niphandrodes]
MKIKRVISDKLASKRRRTTVQTTISHASAMGTVCTKPNSQSASAAAAPVAQDAPARWTPEKTDDVLEQKSRKRLSLAHVPRPNTDEHSNDSEPEAERGAVLKLSNKDKRQLRLSVCGSTAPRAQGNFEQKLELLQGNLDEDLESFGNTSLSLPLLRSNTCANMCANCHIITSVAGIGHVCRKGLKPESPNQDDFFVYILGGVRMFGVFDGHGPFGDDISHFVQQRLGVHVWHHAGFGSDYENAMRESFAVMQTEIVEASDRGTFDANLSGCTGTLVIHDRDKELLVTAHVGDSRAVLGQVDPQTGRRRALDLTEDHKPTLEAEFRRITAAGGQVKKLVGDIPHRVFLKGRQVPGLAMSRAFGDLVAVQAGVIAEPQINTYKIPHPGSSSGSALGSASGSSSGAGEQAAANKPEAEQPPPGADGGRLQQGDGPGQGGGGGQEGAQKKDDGEKQSGEKQSGEKQEDEEKQSGEKQSGEKQSGEKQSGETEGHTEPLKNLEECGPLLIVCSDGVWEFISTAEAVAMVSDLGPKQVQHSAEVLAREAWNRWIDTEGDVVDDITVEIAYLNFPDAHASVTSNQAVRASNDTAHRSSTFSEQIVS